jgi:3-hydroxy acid dehydrogenase / malonic semialdehyde reductase
MKTIVITGASSGIGKACAYRFAQNNNKLILTARRADKLEELKNALDKKTDCQVKILVFDVRNREQVFEAFKELPADWKEIDVLINNAGLAAGLDFIQDGSFDDWDAMIDTNVKGLLNVSKALIPGMISRQKGHIIHIGSIAGKEVYPKGNVYCASKHAVDALTKGIRMDLLPYGIKVSQIAPGAVETEFSLVRFKGDVSRAEKVYDGFTPLNADDIADACHYVANLPAHVNINDLLIMPTAQASAGMIHRETQA